VKACILSFRDVIQSAYNTLRKDPTYLTAKEHAEDAKNKLFQLAGAIIASEKELFDKANALLKPFDVGVLVSDDKSYHQALDALRGKISQPDRAEKRMRLDQLKKDCQELINNVGFLVSKKNQFLAKYAELVKNKDAVSQLNIEQFLRQGHKVIIDGHFHDQQCPFCLTPFDLDKLRTAVDERIKGIAKIREQYDETKALNKEFTNATKSANAVCERLAKNYDGLDKFTELVATAEYIGKTQ
jgi:hypothetical protein